jgi:mono/diheme cytochrome c family protein
MDIVKVGKWMGIAAFCLGAAGAAGPAAAGDPAPDARVQRGRYLVTLGGCNDCHTPLKMGPNGPELDLARKLSGHPEAMVMPPAPRLPPGPWMATVGATMTAWSGPWGTSFTANLTPDEETGLGRWSERNFVDTIRNGRHLGQGRALLPPMPMPSFELLSDADLGDVFAYLRSIPAVKNRVPAPIPPPAPAAAAPTAPSGAEARR